jgi:hypothetical protein
MLSILKKGASAIKKKINKKDSKGNTVSILGKPSANQTKIKKAQKQQRTTRREKAKSLAKGVLGTVLGYETAKALTGQKSQAPAKPVSMPAPKKKSTPKSIAMPKPKPKNKMYMKEKYTGKDSNVEFAVGKAKKKLFGGGKVGGMKSGPAMPNRLY